MQRRRFVSDPDEAACAADDGRMMWSPACDEMFTEFEDAKDIFRMADPRPFSCAPFESGWLLTPAFARNVPKLSFLCGSVGLAAFSFGGVSRNAGVVASEDSSEVGYGW